MDPILKSEIGHLLGTPVIASRPLSGGDISNVTYLETAVGRFICKWNSGPRAMSLLQAEKEGLEAIAQTQTVKTPEIFHCAQVGDRALLIMEYIERKKPAPEDMRTLGEHLAALHEIKQEAFGWQSQNYIGSLVQNNRPAPNWPEFFTRERLQPQMRLAVESGFLQQEEVPAYDVLEAVLRDRCGGVQPSLLHGDLWNGNFLISRDRHPYLIDPAVYRGHNEVDLAMSHLFGGFSSDFYSAYHSVLKSPAGEEARRDLYQLYYLLVHLNLFGRSYYPAVRQTLRSYFRPGS